MFATVIVAALLAAASLETDIQAAAAIPGEPSTVAAAGLTKADAPILSIENGGAFDPTASIRRLVLVGAVDADGKNAQAVLEAVKWLKGSAPRTLRQQWIASAIPSAGFEADDPASLERWVTFQAPDLLVEVRSDGRPSAITALGSQVIAPADAIKELRRLMEAAPAGRSPLHASIVARVARRPIDIATLLARRYPETPSISYIPALAWANSLKVATLTGDRSLADKVRQQTAPWVNGQPLFGARIQLTAIAGTMIFFELGGDALPLARQGATLAAARKADGVAEYGQGWTDDMFMASAILARVGSMQGESARLDEAARLLVDYAARLQRPDGVFIHAVDGPYAWGRGNGFAAFGLIETLARLPQPHPLRAQLVEIFRRHMNALKAHQSPDGMWREVIDEPGAYREETATAMVLTAMARGLRLGLLDASFTPLVERAWRGLAAHVREDGTTVDVCTGTGVGPTRRYYLDRAAITGPDERGGAMALTAAVEWMTLRDRPAVAAK
jgi:unsaturated rhamnogalacturonyl hydrolase